MGVIILRIKGNWIIGLVIIAAGIILLLNNIGLTDFNVWVILFTYWPVFLVIIGLNSLLNRGSSGEVIFGIVFIALGIVLLGRNAGIFNFNIAILWKFLWPGIIILIGLSFIFSHSNHGNSKSNYAIMGSVEKKTEPWQLQSSSYIAFWGGIELDLTLADISDGETNIDLTAIMGGIEILVPDDINIECNGTAILGGVELLDRSTGGLYASTSSSQRGTVYDNKIVKFYSRAIMGGIEIKRKRNKE